MEVGNVVIGCCCRAVVVDQTVRHADVIISEIQRFGRRTVRNGFPQQLPARVDILVGFAVFRPGGEISAGPVAGKELRVWEEKRYQLYD